MPCDCVYATVVPDEKGRCATLYWSRSRFVGPVLTLLDFDFLPLTPELWAAVEERLGALAIERGAMMGSLGCFIEGEHLAIQGRAAGYPVVAFPEHLTKPDAWNGLCQSVTLYRKGDRVTTTAAVITKAREQKALGALTFDFGPRGEDATVPAFVYGVVMALDEAMAQPRRKRPDRVRVVS